jgi:hypothetical protein
MNYALLTGALLRSALTQSPTRVSLSIRRTFRNKKSGRANGGLTISSEGQSVRLRTRMETIRAPLQPWSHRRALSWPVPLKRRRCRAETVLTSYHALRFAIGTALNSHAAWPTALRGALQAQRLLLVVGLAARLWVASNTLDSGQELAKRCASSGEIVETRKGRCNPAVSAHHRWSDSVSYLLCFKRVQL